MATIRNQYNSNLVVTNQDVESLNRDCQAACAPGSSYLPSVSGFMLSLPSKSGGRKHETTRRLAHDMAITQCHAWSGNLGQSGCRATSVPSSN